MSGNDEREIRAFEAIIVSQVLRDRDPMNLDDLPELSEAQRAAMNALPENLVDNLWDEIDDDAEDACSGGETCDISADEEEFAGMNRAEEMDEETRTALDEARKEVLESMRKQRKEQDGANG